MLGRLARSESMDIFISRDGSHYGPFQQADVERMLTDGQLLESDLAWCESLDGWVSLSSLISRQSGVQSDSTVMPDSVAAAAGVAMAFSLFRPHRSKAEHIESSPTNAAPASPDYIESESPVEDLAALPPLPAEPPPIPPEVSEPPVIEDGAADFVTDEVLMEDMIEPDLDLEFDMPDIDIDFDF